MLVISGVRDHRHAVVDLTGKLIGGRRDDNEGLEPFAGGRIFSRVPESSERKRLTRCSEVGIRFLRFSINFQPLVKAVRGNQAAVLPERSFPERLLLDRLRFGVDGQNPDSGSGASPACDRSLAQALEGPLTGGPDVPHIRTRGTEGTGGASLGKELPPVAHPSNSPEAGHSRSACHFSGDAPHSGDGHAAARHAKGHAGHVAAREPQDHGRCLRSDDRTERSRRRELARTSAVLGNWKMPDSGFGLKGRNLKGLNEIRRSSAKSISEALVSA